MTMAISETDYKELKEYWDYQRKVEYNREKVFYMAERIAGNTYTEFGKLPVEEVQSILWSKIKSQDYDNPPKGYIPENSDYRLWNEAWPPTLDIKKALDDDYNLQESY